MTIEEVDWILRYPSDEMVLSQEMLNTIAGTIAASKATSEPIRYSQQSDPKDGRLIRIPSMLAGRKITLDPIRTVPKIELKSKGEVVVSITFPW